jgi:hypothetical protein
MLFLCLVLLLIDVLLQCCFSYCRSIDLYFAGALYDTHADASHQCVGVVCFRESFLFLCVMSMALFTLTAILFVHHYKNDAIIAAQQ